MTNLVRVTYFTGVMPGFVRRFYILIASILLAPTTVAALIMTLIHMGERRPFT